MAGNIHGRRKRNRSQISRFLTEALETRRLLFGGGAVGLAIGSTLQATEFSSSTVTVSPNTMIPIDIKATGFHAVGSPVTAPTGTVQISWAPSSPGAAGSNNIVTTITLAPTGGTDSLGDPISTGSALFPLPVFESTIISGAYSGDSNYQPSSETATFSVVLNQSPKLAFIQNPSTTPAGATISPPITVAYEDQSGNILTADNNYAFLSIASGPINVFNAGYGPGGHGYSSGDQTEDVAAVNGIATFSDLQISTNNVNISPVGTYTLAATDADLIGQPDMASPATSTSFNITGGGLAFITPPTGGTADSPITPPVVVALQNSSGVIDTSDNTTVVTLNLLGVTSGNPITGNTATMVHGEATFSKLVIQKPGFYTLQASDGGVDATAVTSKFKITGDHLLIKAQPKDGNANTPIPLTVEIDNTLNKPDTTATSYAVLTLNAVSGGAGAVLSGTTVVQFVGGKAVFNAKTGPVISASGTYTFTVTEEDYTLGALAPTNTTTAIQTNQFSVAGLHLVFRKQPVNSSVNAPLTLTVAIEDAKNKVDTTDNTTAITIGFETVANGTTATLLGATTVTVVNGIATFSATTNVIKFDTQGTYKLTADDGTDPVIKSAQIEIKGAHLVFSIPPHAADVNQALQFAITEKDASNKDVTTDNSSAIMITVVDATTGAPAKFSVESAVPPVLTAGVINFGNAQIVTIDQIGTFNITATAVLAVAPGGVVTPLPNIAPVTFKNLKITGYHLVFFNKPPATNTVDQPIPFIIAIKDDRNVINKSDDSTGLEFSLNIYTGAANNAFTTNVNVPVLSNGEAVFDATNYFKISEIEKVSITVNAIDPLILSGNNSITTTKSVTSPVFAVKGYHLALIAPVPSKNKISQPIPFTVAIKDSGNNINHADNTTALEFSLKTYFGGNGNNSFVTNVAVPVLANGEAVFDASQYFEMPDAGKYSFTVTAIDPATGGVLNTVEPVTSSVFAVDN